MRKAKYSLAAAMLPLAACSTVGEGTDFGVYQLVGQDRPMSGTGR